jgi:hypothetical protein
LQQEIGPFLDEYEQLVREQPWLEQIDQWRRAASGSDVRTDEEETGQERDAAERGRQGTRALIVPKKQFALFLDAIAFAPDKFDTLPQRAQRRRDRVEAFRQDGATLFEADLTRRFNEDISPAIPEQLVNLGEDVMELYLVQARVRTETVSLVNVDLHPSAALEIARVNRRDWMNARAELVDRWRAIEVVADELEGYLDIEFHGDIRNDGSNPVKLDAGTGSLQATLNFDAPLTRLAERNAYREVLIDYQRARREYYAFEDVVSGRLRDIIRTLQLNQNNFEVRRAAVRVAAQQIELVEERRRVQESTGEPAGPTTARDTVSALREMLNSQNDILSVWVTYEALRRTLDFELGTMQLDSDGMWIDPGQIGPEQGYPGIGDDERCWPGEMIPAESTGTEPPLLNCGDAAG